MSDSLTLAAYYFGVLFLIAIVLRHCQPRRVVETVARNGRRLDGSISDRRIRAEWVAYDAALLPLYYLLAWIFVVTLLVSMAVQALTIDQIEWGSHLPIDDDSVARLDDQISPSIEQKQPIEQKQQSIEKQPSIEQQQPSLLEFHEGAVSAYLISLSILPLLAFQQYAWSIANFETGAKSRFTKYYRHDFFAATAEEKPVSVANGS